MVVQLSLDRSRLARAVGKEKAHIHKTKHAYSLFFFGNFLNNNFILQMTDLLVTVMGVLVHFKRADFVLKG